MTAATRSTLRNSTYILTAAALAGILYFHFLPLMLAVVLTYVFITKTNGLIFWLRRRVLPRHTKMHQSLTVHNVNIVSTVFTIGLVLLAVFLMVLGVYHLIHGGPIGVMRLSPTPKTAKTCRPPCSICCRPIWLKSKPPPPAW